MGPELYEAAIDGTLSDEILRASDPNQLVTAGQNNTILHVAAKSGNLHINKEDEDDDRDPHPALLFCTIKTPKGTLLFTLQQKQGTLKWFNFWLSRQERRILKRRGGWCA